MKKARFIIDGSGWRSLYFVRIARALPDMFDMCAMLCRTQEKADRMAKEHGIHTTTSVEECIALRPDFVVTAVTKPVITNSARFWLDRGFTVLSETPAAVDLPALIDLWERRQAGQKLVIAEQYTRYPVNAALLRRLRETPMGEPCCLNLSVAHEYHGANLMRAFLQVGNDVPFTVRGKNYMFPTAESLTRYERITDGRVTDKQRTVATFEFEGGKVGLYDFDSEQYRAPIRRNHLKLQCVRGELLDGVFYRLNDDNLPVTEPLEVTTRRIETGDPNPNLCVVEEVTGITCGGDTVYTPPFGLCGMTQDETAIAQLMAGTAAYAWGEADSPMPLADSLQDAYMTLLLQQAVETGETVSSQPQPWQK